jgi:GNAT superfamily N-acetyltransferase
MAVTVRRVTAGDAARFREVRLAALQDAPSAFGSTYAREVGLADTEWEERVRLASAGAERAHFLAEDDGVPVGLVGVFAYGGGWDLISMWTSPAVRRRGVGRLLVDAAVDWARSVGAGAVHLWVTAGNEPAENLYAALGFRRTGEVQPLPSDPSRDEVRMVLPLTGS